MAKKRQFKISSALKSLIGRDLITSDFVAIFELVKNSFDAYAKNVEVSFVQTPLGELNIIITDDGKGMSVKDVENKWLFVAYSAKKDGTEDEGVRKVRDYRERIGEKRAFAGAKGVGRFSCDRLGRSLKLYTKQKGQVGPYTFLDTDWTLFESDSKEDFTEVSVELGSAESAPKKFKTGTLLLIEGLRSSWDREKFLKLKRSLQKLINPNQTGGSNAFSITLNVPSEKEADAEVLSENPDAIANEIVNGKIENFVFEDLKIRTTLLRSEISEDGETITTSLQDRGKLIYEVVESNPHSNLRNIKMQLFALNRSAKLIFAKRMGMPSVQYGSIYIYKGGFRVNPFGEPGQDVFSIDRRKQQGVSRYLGTRDLAGRIEIDDDSGEFTEVSSRDGGFIETMGVQQLEKYFHEFGIRRLERYVVEVIRWGNPINDEDDFHEGLEPEDVRGKIWSLIESLTKSPRVIDFSYDNKVLDFVELRQEAGGQRTLKSLEKVAEKTGDEKLQKDVKRAQRSFEKLRKDRQSAIEEIEKEKKATTKLKSELKLEKRKNQYLMDTEKDLSDDAHSLIHWMKILGNEIGNKVSVLHKRVASDELGKEELLEGLQTLKAASDKILTVSRVVTKSTFDLQGEARKGEDLALFIFEYIDSKRVDNSRPKINIEWDEEAFVRKMKPIDYMVLFDNLIDNASKAYARNASATIQSVGTELIIEWKNDGRKVPEEIEKAIFDLGVSGRGGSGIGMYTCKKVLRASRGDITYEGAGLNGNGASFKIRINK